MHLAKTKIAIVIAIVALSSTGHAQTNVQLYGLVDAGVEYVDKVRTGAAGSETKSMVRVQSGSAQSSRFGFRMREDLGDGLSAVFVLESGIAIDSGTLSQGGRLFGRHAYVGLKHKSLGELQLGRQTSMVYDYGVQYDPVTATRYSSVVFDASYAGRADNAVKYVGNFDGLSIGAQYSFGYDSLIAGGSEVPGASKVGRKAGVHMSYTIGGAQFGVLYDRQNGVSVATQRDTTVRMAVGGLYNFAPVKLFASYQRQRMETAVTSRDINLYWVGAQYSTGGPFTLIGSLYFNDPDGSAKRSNMLTIFASYALSKRTDLYSEVALMKNQDVAMVGMGGAVNPGDHQRGAIVGIRHRF
jgi:predicted porin